jgi:DNA-binding NtrC family response regulator
VARADAPVLITGETGSGKEVVARLVAELSPRAARPFVALNCGSLSRNLIESELFGHERGAFTGAVSRKSGAFEVANGGTLFLDEVGELPLELQPQLLRVLETGEVRRVGSTESFYVDVHVIAATNRQLQQEVAAGTFREDLFHRLHVLAIELPSLVARRDDIPELAEHFLASFAPVGQRVEIDGDALDVLRQHDWPGNVRELRNVLQRAVLLRRGDRIEAADITFTPSTLASRVQTLGATSGRTLQDLERHAITTELRRFHGNRKEAAAALGISRSTIHRKIDEYDIDVDSLG